MSTHEPSHEDEAPITISAEAIGFRSAFAPVSDDPDLRRKIAILEQILRKGRR